MDLALLFFLPLLGGYLFVVEFYGTRFRAARQETQRVYYQAAFYGVILAAIGLTAHWFFSSRSTSYRLATGELRARLIDPLLERPLSAAAGAASSGNAGARADLVFACFWGFVLGAATPLLNLAILAIDGLWIVSLGQRLGQPSLRQMINRRSIRDQFELLLTDALIHAEQVQVTLVNRKVYTGWVTQSVNPQSQEKYVRLQPSLSGFRSEDTGEVQFTTAYTEVLKPGTDERKLKSFQIVIPFDKVVSASGFDPQAYVEFQARREARAQTAPKATQQHRAELVGHLRIEVQPSSVRKATRRLR